MVARPAPSDDALLPVPGSRDYGVDPATLQQDWITRAEHLGWTRDRIRSLLHTTRPNALVPAHALNIAADLLGSSGLTAHKPTFTRRDVVRGWAERLAQGASAARLEALADAVLADDTAATVRLRGAEEVSPDVDRSVLATTVEKLTASLDARVAAEVRASAPLRANVARAIAAGLDPATVTAALLERELAAPRMWRGCWSGVPAISPRTSTAVPTVPTAWKAGR